MRQRILAGIILSLSVATSNAASFTPLGVDSYAYDVSGDGSVVVGSDNSGSFRWTSSSGLVHIGPQRTYALGVNANGNVVIGNDYSVVRGDFTDSNAFRWTATDGMSALGKWPANAAYDAYRVSADGSVVVGRIIYSDTWYSTTQAVRWTASGEIAGLGFLPGDLESVAWDVSADGTVVVGNSHRTAFRWTAESGMVPLADRDGISAAQAISADGKVIVGAAGRQPVRWTSEAGMVSLDLLVGQLLGEVTAVSADGSVMAGDADSPTQNDAMIWLGASGPHRLLNLLVANGVDGLNGWQFPFSIRGISEDGQWVVGWGIDPSGKIQGFVANIAPVPIPAVGWLLGPALGVLGWVRRKSLD